MAQAEFGAPMRKVCLENDFGGSIYFTGRLLAEDLCFDEATGVLTVEKIYRTKQERLGYSVVTASGETRERRAYLIEEMGDSCLVSNGALCLALDNDELIGLLAMALGEAEDRAELSCHHMRQRLAAVNG